MQFRVYWPLIAFVILVVGVLPFVHYRSMYAHSKRLRVVDPGKVYRSGQMTADGFREAIDRLGIRTVVNLQEDYPDPALPKSFFDSSSIKESQLCRELDVNYVTIPPDLVPRRQSPQQRPEAVEKMLAVFDDPTNYPILIHCRAGLHRTGCMAGIYRIEYQHWTPQQAIEEMRRHGFGNAACTAANDYVYQYVLTYKPGIRGQESGVRSQESGVKNHQRGDRQKSAKSSLTPDS